MSHAITNAWSGVSRLRQQGALSSGVRAAERLVVVAGRPYGFPSVHKNVASRTSTAVETAAAALGAVRAGVHGVFLLVVLHDSWQFSERLLSPQGRLTLKLALLVSLAMSTAGWWTSLTVKSSALLVMFYEGLLRGFGHYNHN